MDLNQANNEGVTPLIFAARAANERGGDYGESHWLNVVTYLAEQGVDLNKPDNRGTTALMAAIEGGATRIVKYLCKKGVNLFQVDQKTLFKVIMRSFVGTAINAISPESLVDLLDITDEYRRKYDPE